MIESPGNLRTERRETTPAGAQVNIKTDNCSYLHTDSRRQHQTDLERRTLGHNGEEEEKKHNQTTEWHSDMLHRAQSNFDVLGCDEREALLQSRLSDPS